MRIGVLGSGLMGGKLGTILARAGHDVAFSYARRLEKLAELAREAGGTARAGTPREAAQDADALLLAVHWLRVDDVLHQTGDLSGKVILTCSLPMDADNTRLVIGHTTSGAEELARKVPKAKSSRRLIPYRARCCSASMRHGAKRTGPVSSTAATMRSSKKVAAGLIHDVGFEPVDAGPLRIARYTEPFALLMGQLAYEGKDGPELAYRLERRMLCMRAARADIRRQIVPDQQIEQPYRLRHRARCVLSAASRSFQNNTTPFRRGTASRAVTPLAAGTKWRTASPPNPRHLRGKAGSACGHQPTNGANWPTKGRDWCGNGGSGCCVSVSHAPQPR